ncbi:MAG TPA: hypothetical protein IAB62_04150 [Candidatus Coprocola pullicola]|nr:hypothetical protein [Candidatus Coprocola pullicola]
MGLVFGFALLFLIGGIVAAIGLLYGIFFIIKHKSRTKYIRLKIACLTVLLLFNIAIIIGAYMLAVSVINY